MRTPPARILLWSPRVLGLLVCLYLGLFALDVFGETQGFLQALPAFAIHAAPALVLLLVVGLSWRWPLLGGIVFTGLALAYAYLARGHLGWIPCISGPLLVVGILFVWSWRQGRQAHPAA
jgi:hypothetical protein